MAQSCHQGDSSLGPYDRDRPRAGVRNLLLNICAPQPWDLGPPLATGFRICSQDTAVCWYVGVGWAASTLSVSGTSAYFTRSLQMELSCPVTVVSWASVRRPDHLHSRAGLAQAAQAFSKGFVVTRRQGVPCVKRSQLLSGPFVVPWMGLAWEGGRHCPVVAFSVGVVPSRDERSAVGVWKQEGVTGVG